jgi:hypothetical protein
LSATVPVNPAGMRTEPPPSVPTDQVPMPSPTAAAEPPLDPPAVRAGSQGLPVGPYRGESVTPFQPNSGVVVLPSSTDPDSRSRATAGASSVHGPAASSSRLPRSVGQAVVSSRSLIGAGTPSNGLSGRPSRHRRSDFRAAASAASESTRTNACTAGSRAAIVSRAARVTSTGESRPLR